MKIKYISNKVIIDKKLESYCGIFGESPSQGARSPVLWNSCFDKFKIASHFHPFDVTTDDLVDLLNLLSNDPKFMGGAVAVPHKERIIPLLDSIDKEAELIGAVNLIYRKSNGLCGANTDGLGAVESLAEYLNQSVTDFARDKKAVIIGTGGAAKAVGVYMAKCLGKNGNLIISGRDDLKIDSLVTKCSELTNTEGINLMDGKDSFHSADFIINSTSIGYENIYINNNNKYYLEPFNPLGICPNNGFKNQSDKRDWLLQNAELVVKNYEDSIHIFKQLDKNSIIMDVVYQPEQTVFLRMAKFFGHKTLSGKRMNLLQAAYGFHKAFPQNNIGNIVKVMETV